MPLQTMLLRTLINTAKWSTVTWSVFLSSAAWVLVLSLVVGESARAATGSWSSQMPAVMVAMSDRASSSQAIRPPAGIPLGDATLARVQWRFEAPAHAPVNAWLCHPAQCVPLSGMRGSTMALAGLEANAPLHLRFALSPGQRPVRVQGLQVIVNYQ